MYTLMETCEPRAAAGLRIHMLFDVQSDILLPLLGISQMQYFSSTQAAPSNIHLNLIIIF